MRKSGLIGAAIGGLIVGAVATFAATGAWRSALLSDTAPVQSFQRTGDPRQIVVVVMVGLGDRIVESTARETDTTVTPIVRVSSPPGIRPAIGILVTMTITLRDALGSRNVLDGSGKPVLDLGTYRPPREPPIDLNEIGIVQKGTFRTTGDAIDLEWRNASGTPAFTLAQLRGSTVVMLSRTSFSNEAKMSLLALQDRLAALPPHEAERVVVVLITLNEDPQRAAIVRPSTRYRPLVAFADTTGADAPEILRFASVPVMWFVGPDGTLRHRVERRAASNQDILQGLAVAR